MPFRKDSEKDAYTYSTDLLGRVDISDFLNTYELDSFQYIVTIYRLWYSLIYAFALIVACGCKPCRKIIHLICFGFFSLKIEFTKFFLDHAWRKDLPLSQNSMLHLSCRIYLSRENHNLFLAIWRFHGELKNLDQFRALYNQTFNTVGPS